jgi:hypothetical protein
VNVNPKHNTDECVMYQNNVLEIRKPRVLPSYFTYIARCVCVCMYVCACIYAIIMINGDRKKMQCKEAILIYWMVKRYDEY